MKEQSKWFAGALAVASGLVMAGSANAQAITGPTYMSNVLLNNTAPDALYAGWASGTTVTSTGTGAEVASANYGSCYYAIPGSDQQTLSTLDTLVSLVFTVNSAAGAAGSGNISWMGTPFILSDTGTPGGTTYGGYSGPGNGGNPAGTTWNGNVCTETVSLTGAQLTAIQAGGDAITGFNLETDPASFSGPPTYDITFNSITLSPAPTPEPTSIALLGFGALGGLFMARRRAKTS